MKCNILLKIAEENYAELHENWGKMGNFQLKSQ